jgi:hypothetical protein
MSFYVIQDFRSSPKIPHNHGHPKEKQVPNTFVCQQQDIQAGALADV